ncbi:MAG: hypothetical protein ABH875_01765 [Candidatus Omnitrophota bacterium]
MKLGKREKILAAVFGSFLIFMLSEKALMMPLVNRLDTLSAEIDSSERKLKKLISIDRQKRDIEAAFEALKPYVDIAKTEEGTLSIIMKKVEEMATGCNITVLNMKPDTEPINAKPGYVTKTTEMSIEGSQVDIIKFLYVLENSKYPLTIDRLDYKVKDRGKSLMEAELEVHFLYFL